MRRAILWEFKAKLELATEDRKTTNGHEVQEGISEIPVSSM